MRPSQWRNARPLASVNVTVATSRVGGADGWRAAAARGARSAATAKGTATATGTIAAFPRGNDYARVLERRSARSKNTRRRRFSSPMRVTRRTSAPPRCRATRTSIPRPPRTGGGRCPGADRGLLVRFDRLFSSLGKPRGTILPSRVTGNDVATASRDDRARRVPGVVLGRCTSRSNASATTRAENSSIDWATRSESPGREKLPDGISSDGAAHGRDSRVRWGRRRVPRRRRGTSSFDPPPRRPPIVSPPRVSGRCTVGVGGVGADRLTRVTVRRVGRGGGGASRGADDRQGRVRHRGGGGARRRAQPRDGRERRVSGAEFADASRSRRIGGGRNRTVRDFAGCDRVSIFIDRSRSRSRRGNRRRRRPRSRRSSLGSRAPSVFVCAGAAGFSALLRLDLRRHLAFPACCTSTP